jgi:hypothetical protein
LVVAGVEHNQTVLLADQVVVVGHGTVLATLGEQALQGRDMLAETVLLLLMLELEVGVALVLLAVLATQ